MEFYIEKLFTFVLTAIETFTLCYIQLVTDIYTTIIFLSSIPHSVAKCRIKSFHTLLYLNIHAWIRQDKWSETNHDDDRERQRMEWFDDDDDIRQRPLIVLHFFLLLISFFIIIQVKMMSVAIFLNFPFHPCFFA